MSGFALRVTRERLEAGQSCARPLPPTNRVLYVLHGEMTGRAAGREAHVPQNGAWHATAECSVTAGRAGATLLRYELVGAGAPAAAAAADSRMLLEHPIALEPAQQYLMRCDRVDFDLGAEALPHRHKGGGIRCLVSGTMELRVEGERDRLIKPGEAWFESGHEPVYARASAQEPTSFIRCSILPREIRGQSSIMYVDPKDAGSKPRKYTVFVDEPIELLR